MEWKVEEDKTTGAIWIKGDEGDVCNLYYRIHYGHSTIKTIRFNNAKEHAVLITKAPHQQALIEELVNTLKETQAWFDRNSICKAMSLQLRIELALAKASSKEKEEGGGYERQARTQVT